MRTNQKPEPPTPGFSIRLGDHTSLGFAMLIAEDEFGGYLPVSVVSNIDEGLEIARDDMRLRMEDLENGKTPFCPEVYKIWARGVDGYALAAEFDPCKL
jgi:hypothetical protein